jgi:hypothetical protein
MPIEIKQQDTKLSFAYAVNNVQDIFTINEDDGKLKTSGKAVTRFLANSALAVAALVETVVKALLVAVTLGLHNGLKAALSLAGRTTLEAFKGTLGFSTPKPIVETPPPPTPVVETPPPPQVEPTPVKTKQIFDYYVRQPTRTERFVDAVKAEPAFTTIVAITAALTLNMILGTNSNLRAAVDLSFCIPAIYGLACGVLASTEAYAHQVATIGKAITGSEPFVQAVKKDPAFTTLIATNASLLLYLFLDNDSYLLTAAKLSYCFPFVHGLGCGLLSFAEGFANQVAYVGSGISQAASFACSKAKAQKIA